MKRSLLLAVVSSLVVVVGGSAWAHDTGVIVRPFAAVEFATMPEVANFPEGITANPYNGDIFVSTFEFDGSGTETNGIVRFNRRGHVEAKSDFSSNIPLLGLAFNRQDKNVYVASIGNFQGVASKIQRIGANFSKGATLQDVAAIPNIGAPGERTVPNPDGSSDTIVFRDNAAVPNALAFRKSDGALFVSDSFQGKIFKIVNPTQCDGACVAVPFVDDPLLATAGFPPFGANGLAFSKDEAYLYVANTGDDRVLRVNMVTKLVEVLAESINGADGLAWDEDGILWVAANQADQVVALDSNGRPIAELGESLGVRHGKPIGLLFPASLVIFRENIFVTNLALPLTPPPSGDELPAAGDELEEQVDRYTISRIRIPRPLR